MKIAFYIGNHSKDTLSVRLGCQLTRLFQRTPYHKVTHVEAILAEYDDGTVDIGSSSLRDGGVRIKRCQLDPDNWWIIEVPSWRAHSARAWFDDHKGEPYDLIGAMGTGVCAIGDDKGKWFCSESVGAAAGVANPHYFGPAALAALCLSMPGAQVVSKQHAAG